jgi:putative SOS response-associated peptidase YedK
MCGRFAQITPLPKVSLLFEAVLQSSLPPRYNVAPGQKVAVVLFDTRKGIRRLENMLWGFLPAWAVGRKEAHPLINARAETLAEKPSFKESFAKRRCLIPADGFFEWRKKGQEKQPFYFRPRDGGVFALAGLWDLAGKDRGQSGTFTIVTTQANELMSSIHERMPVIVSQKDIPAWLNPDCEDPLILKRYLQPYSSLRMDAFPVSSFVNDAKNEGPDCVQAVGGDLQNKALHARE